MAHGNGGLELDFEILGPLQVLRSGTGLALGGRQQRAVLAFLLTRPRATTSVGRLAEALWGDALPTGYLATVQTYVFHLREVLEPDRERGAPSKVLLTESGGYRLDLGACTMDAARFETLLAEGQASLSAGRFRDAAATLQQALSLWRGQVLADLADFPFVAPVAARLDELRLSALESLVDADMGLGRHAKAVADLDRLVDENPLRERLQGQRMLALYRSGRQSDALHAYRALHGLLAGEVGVEPTPEIRRLHQMVLAQDPRLDWRPVEPLEVAAVDDGGLTTDVADRWDGPAVDPIVLAPTLAGRRFEQQLLGQALEAAAGGHPGAIVVHGEAGVGKTRLVREVCDSFRSRGFQVLWGVCVRFGEASVPFAPVAGALQSWLAQVEAAEREEVLDGADELAALLPGLGDGRTYETGRLLRLIDLVVNRIAERRPTVVVIDDLQWADMTSLDVLAYMVTGFRGQRTMLLATCRDEHRGEGHPLHTWLADMRRMASFGETHLDRLDLEETETQIQGLLGRASDIEFAAEVQERTAGNPYLTELLVGGISAETPALPATAPAALRDALMAKWHGLSGSTRQVARVLAVGGRPVDVEVLAEVAACHGVDPAMLSVYLAEATDQGVVQPDEDGRPWFRHPLLAEVLYEAMPSREAGRVHATYVRILEPSASSTPGRAADLAVHNERAGRADDSYRWSVVAANYAARLHATAEEAIHLERACSLWERVSPQVRGSPTDRVDLLLRASHACRVAGRGESALSLVERAIRLVSREAQPLVASTLLRVRSELSWERSAPAWKVDADLLAAVELTAPFPGSAERADALASLAMAEAWDEHPEAAAHAEAAVQMARSTGSQQSIARALSTRAAVLVHEPDSSSMADAEEAARLARLSSDSLALGEAAIWRVNRLQVLGRIRESTIVAHEAFDEVRRAGSVQWPYFLAAMAADGMLFLGRWHDCRDLLRTALAARCGGIPGAAVRLAAAELEVRTGNVAQARQHLDRALELVSDDFEGLRGGMAMAGAEVLVASGEPRRALDWVRERLDRPGATPRHYDEELLVPLANAAAEVACSARQAGDPTGAAHVVTLLQDVIGGLPREPFVTPRPDLAVQAMERSLFEAEVARCRGDADQAVRWENASQTCRAAGARWCEAMSSLRFAQAMLAAGSPRAKITEPLRQAHRFAVEVGARPMQSQVESLARTARIGLGEP